MVQNNKSKKAKQAEKATPVSNGTKQAQSLKKATSQNHTENESEMNSVPKVESKINGVAESESSSNGAKLPQSKIKGRPKKEMGTVEPCSSGTLHKRKVDSPDEEIESEEVTKSESVETVAPARKSRRKEATAKDKKEETEQESGETTAPTKRPGRRATNAQIKTKETVEQADEIGQEPAETSEPEKKSRKRKAAEPIKAEETKSKKRDVKKAASVTKTKKQEDLLSIPSAESVSGKVFVIGQNDVGQLGFNPEVEVKKRPAMLELPYAISSIAAGGMHSVCLTETGEVITFGCNDEGALGRITADEVEEATPGRVEIPERVIQISAGDSHSAALTVSGKVFIWGNFRSGDGPMGLTTDGKKQIKPLRIFTNIQIVKISSGADHLVCLSSEGIVYTCGCGQNGQLGRLTERACPNGGRRGLAALLEPAAVPVRGQPRTRVVLIEDIWASNYSTFLKAHGTGLIYAFGLNNYFQLGDNNERVAYTPKQITSFNNHKWKEISGGQHHTLSLDSDGLVYSMGRQDYGRLGLGENPGEMALPTLIPTLENEKCRNISCGDDQSFAITEEGSLYSWGFGTNNQLGHGNDDDCHIPTLVGGNFVNSWKALKVSGGGQHALILATPKEGGKSDNKK